jgi:hypothetical protein
MDISGPLYCNAPFVYPPRIRGLEKKVIKEIKVKVKRRLFKRNMRLFNEYYNNCRTK